jgi:hypothetical protein
LSIVVKASVLSRSANTRIAILSTEVKLEVFTNNTIGYKRPRCGVLKAWLSCVVLVEFLTNFFVNLEESEAR